MEEQVFYLPATVLVPSAWRMGDEVEIVQHLDPVVIDRGFYEVTHVKTGDKLEIPQATNKRRSGK